MKLTGHKTEAVHRRYAIVSEGDLFESVRKLHLGQNGHPPETDPHRNDTAPEADKAENSL